MPVYSYKSRTKNGQLLTGKIEALDLKDAVNKLREKDYFIIEINEIKNGKSFWNFELSIDFRGLNNILRKKVTLKEFTLFCRQFATLISAGIPLISALNIIIMQLDNKSKLKSTLESVRRDCEAGNSLADSFAKHPEVFPRISIHMVEAGELGGVLDEVLERLSLHFERENELNEKIKSAVTYPVLVFSFSILSLFFLLTFIIPKIIEVIVDAGMELPLPTRVVIALSTFCQNYWYIILGVLIIAYFCIKMVTRKERCKIVLDKALLKLPIFGELVIKIIVARFCSTLGTLLRGGVPLVQALDVVKKASGNMIIAKGIAKAQQSVEMGEGLSRTLEQQGAFPIMVTRMMAVGEATGNLDLMLDKAAEYYEQEVDVTISKLSSILEPLLIVGLGIVIGFIILSVMLPIAGMTGILL